MGAGCWVLGAGCWVHVEHLLVAGRDAELVVVVNPRRLEALVPELLAVALLAARGEDAPAARLERERGVEAAARRAASRGFLAEGWGATHSDTSAS